MARVVFAPALQRHVVCPPAEAAGSSVREVLEGALSANPRARGYILDDQGALRKHMVIFIDGRLIRDRSGLSDGVEAGTHIYVMQSLSGG